MGLNCTCIDEMYKLFTGNLKSKVYENIPHKPQRINKCKLLWITYCLQKIVAEKTKANKEYKFSQSTLVFSGC